MKNQLGKKLFLAIAVIVLLGITPLQAAAQGASGSISGVVRLDGKPLANVEVFVGGFPEPGALYTCTDRQGSFEFNDLPLDVEYISAVGIEVAPDVPCRNPYFFDLRHKPNQPLLLEFFEDHTGVREFDGILLDTENPSAYIEYNVSPWPTQDHGNLTNLVKNSVVHFHDGFVVNGNCNRYARAQDFLDHFIQRVGRLENRGQLSETQASLLTTYAFGLKDMYAVVATDGLAPDCTG